MIKDQLSILIPTYNRWPVLAQTLERTLSILPDGFTVTILNNASTIPGREDVEAVIGRFAQVRCQIVDHPANIGGDAHILRCVEHCETPYLMILGDDDYLQLDAIEKIESYLGSNEKIGWINFLVERRYKPLYKVDQTFSDPYEMVAAFDNWAELLFISTTVFSRDLMRKGLEQAQRYQVTHSSHLIAVLKGWEAWQRANTDEQPFKFVMSAKAIIDSGGHGEPHYNNITLYQGMPYLRIVFGNNAARSLVIRSAVRGGTLYVFKPRVLGKNLVQLAWREGAGKAWSAYWGLLGGMYYMIGLRSIYYKIYYPLQIATISFARLFKRT